MKKIGGGEVDAAKWDTKGIKFWGNSCGRGEE